MGAAFLVLTPALCALGACRSTRAAKPANEAQMDEYVRLVMPARIEIQRYLTKPVSFGGSGSANGLEAILAVFDSAGDATKVLGTFHFELQTRRLSDSVGTRVAFWPIEIGSQEALRQYRDPLTRLYRFPLQIEGPPLRPGRYVLSAWLHLPSGERLSDEYEFSYEGGSAPAPL